ncbi:MAG: bifunctional UDP-N-acetylglucosamine diphosphorylase/glucosamine-1-phosphate N-acetyltransferase GlmU [Pseudomonadota bacterium]
MSQKQLTLSAVILAAGKGTRMRSDVPKVLQPLADKPLLAHVLDLTDEINVDNVVVVYGYGGDKVQAAFDSPNLNWALQAEQLGTGHAVQQAMPQIDDGSRVLVLCGDVPLLTGATLSRLISETPEDSVGVLTVIMDDPTGYGRIIRNDRGTVKRIVEQKDANDDELDVDEINSGVFIVPASKLRGWLAKLEPQNAQGEYYLTDIVGLAVSDGIDVHGVVTDDAAETMGINDRVQLAEAECAFQHRAAIALMKAGARLADPARIDIRGSVTVGRDVFIDVNAVFVGDVVLGDRVHIGPNCVIEQSVIEADTKVFANSLIESSRVGEACNIGPYARLRPGALLERGAKVGNFVEVKKSTIGEGSKVNHLTYIGDAEIGRNVNVGAGTITCNYDGANKHKTIIGDGAFIGSGVELVAPIEVGSGATIGAGTTLSKDAPEGQLTIERARQRTIDGWQRPKKNQ